MNNAKIAAMLLRMYGPVITDEERDELFDIVQDLQEIAKHSMELGAPFNSREAEVFSRCCGEMNEDVNFQRDGDIWKDDTLEKYAEYVHNYEYTYTDEALSVDSSIDTDQVHVGPMAQDLQQVNPAVIVEDPKTGYLTVDTGRLALMNSGVIAELCREVEEIKNGR